MELVGLFPEPLLNALPGLVDEGDGQADLVVGVGVPDHVGPRGTRQHAGHRECVRRDVTEALEISLVYLEINKS